MLNLQEYQTGFNNRNEYWSLEDDKILIWIRDVDYECILDAFKTKRWQDVTKKVNDEYWKKIAADSRLGGKFTGESCYNRFVFLVNRYNYLRSLPRLERILPHNHWSCYERLKTLQKTIEKKREICLINNKQSEDQQSKKEDKSSKKATKRTRKAATTDHAKVIKKNKRNIKKK